jgi:hypothetical protein
VESKNKKEKSGLLEKAIYFLVICAYAIAGYSVISEFITDKDKYFKINDPMSDVG